ncbi:MAG: type II secretion system F family protein [Armatimonadota bacterium]
MIVTKKSTTAPDAPQVRRTRAASDRDLGNLFKQLASLLRAGVSPADAHERVGSRIRHRALREACAEIAKATAEGKPTSETMARYVDLFPPHAVGMVRAAEYGGFLPEGYELLSQQFNDRASMNAWFYFVRWISYQGLIGVAIVVAAMSAFWKAFHAGGNFIGFFVQDLASRTLPIVLVLAVFILLVRFLLHSHVTLALRHRLVLRAPYGFGARARAEALHVFLWTLRNLAHSGIPPKTAWQLAAAATPNYDYARRLYAAAEGPREAEPISEFVVRSELFDADYADMLSIAQQTGDVPGTLDRMLEITGEEYAAGKTKVRFGLGSLGCLMMALTGGAMLIYFFWQYYGRVFEEVDKYMNSP